MKKLDVFKPGTEGFKIVEKAATKAANSFNKLSKEIEKAKETLQGKTKKKHVKKIINSIGQLRTDRLYIGLNDKILYRKVEIGLEMLVSGNWIEVIVTAGFLQNMKFREY